ncbi:hypothetical protein B0T14DRAFT_299392 [Immersiella caudata]|uniref:Uncharacterized protein n=1 Tax=Immersiella caudata TaxID=314043 RepID=A0AA39WF11_9PEZI|nr:hypothetical protein B0T14DRAFT_299392 [Immersiella caudata]
MRFSSSFIYLGVDTQDNRGLSRGEHKKERDLSAGIRVGAAGGSKPGEAESFPVKPVCFPDLLASRVCFQSLLPALDPLHLLLLLLAPLAIAAAWRGPASTALLCICLSVPMLSRGKQEHPIGIGIALHRPALPAAEQAEGRRSQTHARAGRRRRDERAAHRRQPHGVPSSSFKERVPGRLLQLCCSEYHVCCPSSQVHGCCPGLRPCPPPPSPKPLLPLNYPPDLPQTAHAHRVFIWPETKLSPPQLTRPLVARGVPPSTASHCHLGSCAGSHSEHHQFCSGRGPYR